MSPPRQVSPARDESGGRDARFEALLESAPDSIVGVGSDGRILFVNREGERSFGYRREELVGQPVEVLLPERFRAAHGFHRGSYLALPRTRPMGAGLDLVARRRDGSEFPVEISLSPLETADGLIVTAIVRDVTARRAADRRLRDRERQLQTAQQVAQLGSWEYRLGAERVEWSDQLFRIYGLEPGDPRGGTPESLRFVHPDDREAVRQAVETAIADRSPLELEYRIVRTDGAERILSSRGEVIVDPDDGSVRVVGTALDVTERKETERHLRESQRALSTLMSNLPGMAYRCRNDRDWTIEFVSDGCLDVTGYRPDDLVGNRKLSYGEVIHPDDRETVWNDVQAALAAGRLFQLTYRIRHATGAERWVWEQGQGVFGSDGTLQAIEGFLTDITSRQRAFEELARARDEALEASRLKSAFLANISHEIRTPLNVILGYNTLVAEHLAELGDGSQKPLLDGIERAGRRLIDTIHQVLDYSRIETGRFEVQPKDVDLHSVVDPLAEDHRVLAEEKGLRFSWENHCPGSLIRIDAHCLAGAVRNLLDNAVKFTERGEVSVRVYRDAAGLVCLSVHDTGVGISEAYLQRLFEPFSQEETGYTRSFEGSGLGLSLARKYLELSGAELLVQSRKGSGSTFTIRFGRDDRTAARAAAHSTSSGVAVPATNGRKPVLVLVEDDAQTQAYMKEALRSRFEVLVASSGRKARRHLATRAGEVGVILMDLSLQGGEDGLAFTRWLREQAEWKTVPVIATTAHASSEDRAHAIEAGCNDCLVKPFRHQELLALIDRLC